LQTVEKWATRSDAWTPNDDARLASLVLYHIRTGSTQLRAFEEAANQLGRTAAACGYRWNGVVRKNYRAEIEEAKLERKKSQRATMTNESVQPTSNTRIESVNSSETIKEVIQFLQTYDAGYQKLLHHLEDVEREKQTLLSRVQELEAQLNFEPESSNEPLTPQQLEQDSKTLFAIMERARKLLGEGTRSRSDS